MLKYIYQIVFTLLFISSNSLYSMKEIILEPYRIQFKPVLLSDRIVIPIQVYQEKKFINWLDLKQSSSRDYMNILDAYQDYLDLILVNIAIFFETTNKQIKTELHHKLYSLLGIDIPKIKNEAPPTQSSWITKQLSALISSFYDLEEDTEEEIEEETGEILAPNVNWILVHKQLTHLRSVVEKELKQKL